MVSLDDSFMDLEDLFEGSHTSAATSPSRTSFLEDPVEGISALIPPDLGREVTSLLGLEPSEGVFPALPVTAAAPTSLPPPPAAAPARKRKTSEGKEAGGKTSASNPRSAPSLPAVPEHVVTAEEASRLSKRQKRLVKNRESAMLSRQRKKAYMDDMERKVEELSRENAELKAKVASLQEENRSLKAASSASHGVSQVPSPAATAPSIHTSPSGSPRAALATGKATALLAVVLCCGLFLHGALDPSPHGRGAAPVGLSATLSGPSSVVPFVSAPHLDDLVNSNARPASRGRVLLSDGTQPEEPMTAPRSVEQKRQTLLLVLLQHVCNKLKTSPSTFFVLCQKLYEMGIIEDLALLQDPSALERAYTHDFSNLFVNIDGTTATATDPATARDGHATASPPPSPDASVVAVTDVLKLTHAYRAAAVPDVVFSPTGPRGIPRGDDVDTLGSTSAMVLCPKGSRVLAAPTDDVDTDTEEEGKALSIVVPASAFANPADKTANGADDNGMMELRCAPGSFSLRNVTGIDHHLLSVM